MGERILAVVLAGLMLLQTGLGAVTSDNGREQPQTRVQEEATQVQRQDMVNAAPEISEKYVDYWFDEDAVFPYRIGERKERYLLEDSVGEDGDAYQFSTTIDKRINFQFQFTLPRYLSPDDGETQQSLRNIRIEIYQAKKDYGDYKATKMVWYHNFQFGTGPVSFEKELVFTPGTYLIVFSRLDENDYNFDYDYDDDEWVEVSNHVNYSFFSKDVSNYATSLSIQKKLSMHKKDKISIKVSDIKPAGAVKGITWKTSDEYVAKVDRNGKVTALHFGECKISATLRNGKKYTCKVYVEDPEFDKNKYILNKGETKILELNNTYQPVVWESSDKSVAKVNSFGEVTARKKGNATITAYVGEQVLECKVHVNEPKMSSKKMYILKGEKGYLALKGTNEEVEWFSSNKKVATVSKWGVVRTIKTGKTTITAKVGESKYTCKVFVEENKLKKTSMKIVVKGKMAIGVKKKTKIIKWSSSNKKIATVKNGVVTGKKEGTVVIKAKSKHLTYTCKVKVENPYWYTNSISVYKGSRYDLRLTNTTMKPKWSSSNKKVATVNSKGEVMGKQEGKAVITASVGGRKFTCKVNVTVWKPNYTIRLVKGEYSSTPFISCIIRNNGPRVMRVYARNACLIDGESAEYNRELKLFSYNDFMQYNVITPLSYIDIAPGKEAHLPYEMDPPTRYNWNSTIYFDFNYDGVEYRASNSYNYGCHYERK